MNYLNEYLFSFDDWSYKNWVEEKIDLLKWRKPFKLKIFIYCHPDMEISNIVNRVNWLVDNKCLPYLMRDISCWGSKYNDFYVDLAAFCNQPNLVKKMNFNDYIEKRHKNRERVESSKALYYGG
jgi:hypothetical protein